MHNCPAPEHCQHQLVCCDVHNVPSCKHASMCNGNQCRGRDAPGHAQHQLICRDAHVKPLLQASFHQRKGVVGCRHTAAPDLALQWRNKGQLEALSPCLQPWAVASAMALQLLTLHHAPTDTSCALP